MAQRDILKRSAIGFTLIELIVTVAILAVILSIAVPSFTAFVKNSRIEREAESLYGLFNSARQLAITNGRRAFVCRSIDTATPSCDVATNNGEWLNSKLVYATTTSVNLTNPDAGFTNQAFQTINFGLSADEKKQVIARISERSADGLNIIASSNDDVVVFSSEGQLLNTAPFRIAVCDDREDPETYGKYIEINQTGRFKLKATSAVIGEVGCNAT